MRKALGGLIAAVVLALGWSQLALATNRLAVYPGQNPDVVQENQAWRYQRLADGTVLRDLLGTLQITGAWSSITVVAATPGMYVQVQPSSSPPGQAGMLYQVLADDPSPVPNACPTGFPCSGYQLNADSTQIVIPALIAQNSANIGPLPCNGCTTGQATSYLIEAQIVTAPGNNRSMMFVSSSGAVSFPNVNTEVDDSLVYASIQGGTAAFSTSSPAAGASPNPTPPMPSPAPGWVPLAYVQSYNGGTNCNVSCTITMAYSAQFQADAFGSIQFGGQYAQGGQGGVTASTLTTRQFLGCGLPDGLGMVVQNPSAGNGNGYINNANGGLVRSDQAGDFAVCGSNLEIWAQGGAESTSTVPHFTVFTDNDQPSGTPTPEVLYPASGITSETTSGSCSAGGPCTTSSIATVCGSFGFPNAVMLTVDGTIGTGAPYAAQVDAHSVVNGNIMSIYLYNTGPGSIPGSTQFKIHYVCW